MLKPLFTALTHSVPDLAAPDATPDALRERARRTYVRDLTRLGFSDALAGHIAHRVLAALHLVLADPGVAPDDQAAACLVAERVLMAAASSLVAVWASGEDADLASPQPPLVD